MRDPAPRSAGDLLSGVRLYLSRGPEWVTPARQSAAVRGTCRPPVNHVGKMTPIQPREVKQPRANSNRRNYESAKLDRALAHMPTEMPGGGRSINPRRG